MCGRSTAGRAPPGWLVPYPAGSPILGANIDTGKVVSLEGFFLVFASSICALHTEESSGLAQEPVQSSVIN